MKKIFVLPLFGFFLFLAACAGTSNNVEEENNPFHGKTAKSLFQEAEKAIEKGQYESSIKRLEALDVMYPFSQYGERAQMKLIYAYYKKGDFPSTAAAAERFIHLYPRAKHVDYAYYMKGLANFQQARGVLANVLPLDESWRDPGTQLQAYSDFTLLLQLFPNSPYRSNALQRLIYLRNMFAIHEYNVAKYYFERKKYVASIERLNFLLKNYGQAPVARKALLLLAKANQALGLKKAADDALVIYRQNAPSSLDKSKK